MIKLITGGMRSGKSSFAESLYEGLEDVVYIATAQPTDEEMEVRIRVHKDVRPREWTTFEAKDKLCDAIGREKHYLLDCITNYISNFMYEATKDETVISYEREKTLENMIYEELKRLIDRIREEDKELIIVTNEVGSSLTPMNHIGRVFTDIQGRINQKLAREADQVYMVVSGLEVRLK